MKLNLKFLFLYFLISIFVLSGCEKSDAPIVKIDIKNHKFIPDKIYLEPNKNYKLTIENHDNTVEEFESIELNREKIVPANSSISLFIGPLTPGQYKFFGEFNMESAQGIIFVQEEVKK